MGDPRVWLITGTSSGLGRALTEAVAATGDLVIATARHPEALNDLVARYPEQIWATRLDVTDRAAVEPLIIEMGARFGRIDVLVNNAGHGHVNSAEQTRDAVVRELFELHVFGPAALVRAVLPQMRARRSGTIVQMSSLAAHVGLPGLSAYSSSKAALEGFSEALAIELGPLGIRVMIVEPGQFRTEFTSPRLAAGTPLPEYADTVGQMQKMMTAAYGGEPGDPARAAQAILTALAAEHPPLRLPLGDDAVDLIRAKLASFATEIDDWEGVARATGFSTEPATGQ
jgi:NAD(P)-dependent dehydrogenase (short-subunit alcohol dehydrogenase family)